MIKEPGLRALVPLAAVVAWSMLGCAESAHGQTFSWTVVNLHPADAESSFAFDATTTEIAGFAYFAGAQRAGRWTGTPRVWSMLHTTGPEWSAALATKGGQQVGYTWPTTTSEQAALWTGSPGSWVGLHPAGAVYSAASDTNAGMQCGGARINDVIQAGLWQGTAASWTSLHPAGAVESYAHTIFQNQQGGYARFLGQPRAGIWNGSASSWTDLTPKGAMGGDVLDNEAGAQVGYAMVLFQKRASRWMGTPESWQDLHPFGASESIAYAIASGRPAGYASYNGNRHAMLWHGGFTGPIDLSSHLDGNWGDTIARSIVIQDQTVYIVGEGFNLQTQRTEALLWIGEMSFGCYGDCNEDGTADIDDFICFQTSYALGLPYADCDGDGTVTIDDWICWQTLFALGC